MLKDFAFDLKVARRKSGLSQSDCAHLLDVHRSRISRIEQGNSPPTVIEFCTLSLVHGKSFESLFDATFHDVRDALMERLTTISAQAGNRAYQFNRTNTLNRIVDMLEEVSTPDHDTA